MVDGLVGDRLRVWHRPDISLRVTHEMGPVQFVQEADVLGDGRIALEPEPDGSVVPANEIVLPRFVRDGLSTAA
ncbi:MAG: hypothetical protein KGK01_01215 [Bradyrhizobium sp.]|uniref:hypothetical protein n=1 Tax=Bradyrhizobium sp. TaxID=376 RepID=UPI001C289219|nr:hypothetical protein [Bradyrhizobium sp.]MBU6463952.1 hypothetical protein [Pseudomonadota bacterium]MDE2067503.1 hypothetical protein [Bradyrhizobium sp.]MDE2241085.1 hypothetical protein [Bradyrhizobium sp.]MDE2471393.1 hypothetical protein [Bradyrhizobium sp.]